MVVGSQVAHLLAYRIAYPDAHVRLRELLLTGHAYMVGSSGFLPLLAGVAGGIELVAFVWALVGRVRGRRHAAVPSWAFGLLPPLGFVIQEALERWLIGAPFAWQLLLQPTFRIGLLLQVPFALAAALMARLLLRTAERVAEAFAGRAGAERPAGVCARWFARVAWSRRLAVLADGHAGRGPPVPVAGC
jgi:hypothetical protein